MKNNKGMILIGFVLTIIVSLAISMTFNTGLFDYAKDVATETNQALELEQKMNR